MLFPSLRRGILEQTFEGGEELDPWISGGKAFQPEGTAAAKVPGWKTPMLNWNCSKGPVCLEHGGQCGAECEQQREVDDEGREITEDGVPDYVRL